MAHFPKYEKIKQAIIADLRSGTFAPGSKIPTREELILRFGVTRTTVNQALKELVDSGVLSTSRRGGTVVTGQPMPRRVAFLSWLADPNIMGSAHDEQTTSALLNPLLFHATEFNLEFFDITQVKLNREFIDRYDCIVAVMPSDRQMNAMLKFAPKILFINRYGEKLNFVSTAHREEQKNLVLANLLQAGPDCCPVYLSGRLDACGFVGEERRRGFLDACAEYKCAPHIMQLKSSDFDGLAGEMNKLVSYHPKMFDNIADPASQPLVICSPAAAYTGAVIHWARNRKLRFGIDFFYSDFDNPYALHNTGVAVPTAVQNYSGMGNAVYNALQTWGEHPVQSFIPCYPAPKFGTDEE